MSSQPTPLPPGTLLGDRFRLDSVLGRGGFGIAYLATDLVRQDRVVVKELAPSDVQRTEDGLLDLNSLGETAAHRLRRRFLEEARMLARLNLRGVPNVRAYSVDAGTAYYVSEYYADATPLDRVAKLPVDEALDIMSQLMETLAAVHEKGILHRDIKPANVIRRPNGHVLLLDFGAAREWHADMTEHQTILFTPGFAPLEQLSERARRGPATDIYGLCALTYTILAGFPPASSTDRMNGVPLAPLRQFRPDLDVIAANAIEAGLALHYEERPQSIAALRALFQGPQFDLHPDSLAARDAKLVALKKLTFGKHECPSCGDALHRAKPLPRGRCPVCHNGVIKARHIEERLCPVCRSGILQRLDNSQRPAICPICQLGQLDPIKRHFLAKPHGFLCRGCEAVFAETSQGVVLENGGAEPERGGATMTWTQWRSQLSRPDTVWACDGCNAQFDPQRDGQRKQITPRPDISAYSMLYPEEWARVASGLEPGCGSHVCTACDADYFADGEKITLLAAHEDPFHFAQEHIGRLSSWELIRWLGMGKTTEKEGPTCLICGTEFDLENPYFRLARTKHALLLHHVDQLQSFEDWQRIARGLPTVTEEPEFIKGIDAALEAAFKTGEIGFDDAGTLWRGPAVRIKPEGGAGTLVITPTEVTFGRLRKERIPLEALEWASGDGDILTLQFRGEREPFEYELEEMVLTAHLESGDRTLEVNAADLAERLMQSCQALAVRT